MNDEKEMTVARLIEFLSYSRPDAIIGIRAPGNLSTGMRPMLEDGFDDDGEGMVFLY